MNVVSDMRAVLRATLPYGIVEGIADRRMLRELGAPTTRRGVARLVREARLDLLPRGALRQLETTVDIGANEGRWTAAVAAVARPRRLIAVEPSPAVLPRLRATLAGIDAATIVEAAAADAIGEMTLNLTAHGHNASLVRPRSSEMDALYGWGWQVTGEASVSVTTVDEIVEGLDEVSLLKIDAQGSERAVLAGAARTLLKTRWLLIETTFRSHYEGDILFPELHALLVGQGFVLTGLSAPEIRGGVALWCDSLYARG